MEKNIEIKLDLFEVVNLLQAFSILPLNGDWMINITKKIRKDAEGKGIVLEEEDIIPNSGLTIYHLKRHIQIMETKEALGKNAEKFHQKFWKNEKTGH